MLRSPCKQGISERLPGGLLFTYISEGAPLKPFIDKGFRGTRPKMHYPRGFQRYLSAITLPVVGVVQFCAGGRPACM